MVVEIKGKGERKVNNLFTPFKPGYFSGRMPLLQSGGRWFKSSTGYFILPCSQAGKASDFGSDISYVRVVAGEFLWRGARAWLIGAVLKTVGV